MRPPVCLILLFAASLGAQQTSVPTALPSRPFAIRNTWFIGGQGSWSYLAMDTATNRLYIAHASAVQVVDVQSGTAAGSIGGLGEARDIALDATGGYGYISDGQRARVTVFDRDTLQRVADIPTEPSPSALVFEPQTGLLFAVGSAPAIVPIVSRSPSGRRRAFHAGASVTVIDPQTRKVLGAILLPGALGFARADGNGQIYINFPAHNQILALNAESAAEQLRDKAGEQKPPPPPAGRGSSAPPLIWPVLDWSGAAGPAGSAPLRAISIGSVCADPAGLAADGADARLFVSCANMALAVVNANTGGVVTTLPVGPGADAVVFDPDHGHIFVANGGGDGSLTVVRRNVTDSYQVIQTLPTRRQAHTMAVDSGTGDVYLVTDYLGVERGAAGGFGPLRQVPVPGSFQVLEIGQ